MSKAYRRGRVFVQDRLAGSISETEDGYRFQYEEPYLLSEEALPVSLTLPLREEPYTGSFFLFLTG